MTGFIASLRARELIAQVSDENGLEDHLSRLPRTLYCGFDPTADSLHIGNLVPLLMLRRFQQAGHRPILLLGGATGMIGDPSGRSEERNLQSDDEVAARVERIRDQASQFVDFEGSFGAKMVNNLDWTKDLGVIPFLRDVGKHFSVNAMIQRDSVKARLDRDDAGISYTEFSYMLLQAMDYLELAKRFECSLQVGGSDQWGNIVSGMDLVRRSEGKTAFAMTMPLVTKADGSKFGKTADGAVWLGTDKTSAYSFYQFWLNAADADALNYVRTFTFLADNDIAALEDKITSDPGKRAAQLTLASEVTRLVHGDDALVSAQRITHALFSGAIEDMTVDDLEQLRRDGMESSASEAELGLLAALSFTGLAKSNSNARQLVSSGAITVNGHAVSDVSATLKWSEALFGHYFLIKRGKKLWHLLAKSTT